MKLIFDKDSNGTQELVDALGLIDACRLVEVENLVINLLPYDGTQATYA